MNVKYCKLFTDIFDIVKISSNVTHHYYVNFNNIAYVQSQIPYFFDGLGLHAYYITVTCNFSCIVNFSDIGCCYFKCSG